MQPFGNEFLSCICKRKLKSDFENNFKKNQI
jgi:hypothetical protein